VFLQSAKCTKNQTAGSALLYAHMYVCSCVCDRMHDNDSVTKRLFKLVKQSRGRDADSDKNYIT